MLSQLKATKIEWFGRPHHDARYLDLWRSVPLSYTPGQALGPNWHADDYEEVLVRDENGQVFDRAADRLMRYQIYPVSVMQATSDFSVAQRWMRVGDRILQRVRLLAVLGLPVLELLTMNEVVRVVDEPMRKGFTYVTTQRHSEIGEWSASVEWSASHDVILHINAISKSVWTLPWPANMIVRRYQLHAHRLGIETFKRNILVRNS